jgi:hypothetical protein
MGMRGAFLSHLENTPYGKVEPQRTKGKNLSLPPLTKLKGG